MSDNLSKYILTTLVYYDVMDFPMTSFEIWKYLTAISRDQSSISNEKYPLGEVLKALEDEKLQKFIEEYRGYYFLRGRRELVGQRMERNKISERKIRIVKKVVWWLRFAPYVRSVAVAGRLAMKNAERKSDLDLFIILKKKRIFTGHLMVTILVHFLGKRRHGVKICDRICLNHFITKQFSVSGRDLFAAHEYAFLLPIFGVKSFGKFQAKNDWIRGYKINFSFSGRNLHLVADSKLTRVIRKTLERLLQWDFIEKTLGAWQKKRIAKNPKTQQKGGIILCSSEELAFWPNFENQGPKVFDKFQDRLANLK